MNIYFTPHQETDYNFKLKCKIKRKTTPLVLKVRAEGYKINVGLSYSSPDGNEIHIPVGKTEKRVIDFGRIPVKDRALGQISVLNQSQYFIEYQWNIVHPSKYGEVVSIRPQRGIVKAGEKEISQLQFIPTAKMALKNCQAVLEVSYNEYIKWTFLYVFPLTLSLPKVLNGPTLPITLLGSGVEPSVNFSFEEFNFGPCILHRADMPAQCQKLVIVNKEAKDISIHCLFKSLPHLAVQFEPCLLSPGENMEVILEFRPRDIISYMETVVFEVNGSFHKSIIIRGEGAHMRIELSDPTQKTVSFGALQIGTKDEVQSSKTVKLVNRSPTMLSPTLSIVPSSSVPALQEEGVLSVEPAGEIPLKANGGSCEVVVTFKPTCRVPQFTEEVTVECLGTSQPLFAVTGSCHGLEISLDSEYIPFGAVVQDSSTTRKMLMMNTGDIGAAFHWNEDSIGKEFSISPIEGYISSGMQV